MTNSSTAKRLGQSSAAVIAGVGAWLPERRVTNDELSNTLDTSDEWIRVRTGIGARHVVAPGSSTSDLAVAAGALAIESAGGLGIDAVVLATTTPDHICPSTAPAVAARLGLGGKPAFDVGAVCSGFVYALANATGLIGSGIAENVLVIGADTFSTIVDPADRNTAVIFGDGAGAVVLRAGAPDEPGALRAFDLGSDGDNANVTTVPAGGSRQRSTGPETSEADHYLAMEGRKMFKHAIQRMAESSRTALERTGWSVDDVDVLLPHQANIRIAEGVITKLGVPGERAFNNIEHVGNTAVASIPVGMADAARSAVLQPGSRVLITAFGAGLTWGSATLTWPDVTPLHNLTHAARHAVGAALE